MSLQATIHGEEVRRGRRFEFGKNWTSFLRTLRPERIASAEASLRALLEVGDLAGRRFIDIGSGSGLFSLAARRLGAVVHSFDYDPMSVACTAELRRRYFPGDPDWVVEEGSVLDRGFLAALGRADVVYSWGVLHHTGAMWQALDNVHELVLPGGKLFIAIYNDQGSRSRRWLLAKKIYNRLPRPLKTPFALIAILPTEVKSMLQALLRGRLPEYARGWVEPDPRRGMNRLHDVIDWVGGYPFEVAAPDEIFDFYRARGFTLTRLHCKNVGFGCNEFVFERRTDQLDVPLTGPLAELSESRHR